MARIPYTDPEHASPKVREALDALPQLNIFKMLAHADTAFIPYLRLGGALLAQLELDPKLRELAILLVAKHTDAEYEWIQHAAIAKALNIPDEQITAVNSGDLQAPCLNPDAQTLLHFTQQVLQQPRPDDDTFTALRQLLPPRQIVELLLVIGTYQMLAHIMTTLDIDLDPAAGSAVVEEAQRRLNEPDS
jgi:4-carboxymuconolactone decarboxylase